MSKDDNKKPNEKPEKSQQEQIPSRERNSDVGNWKHIKNQQEKENDQSTNIEKGRPVDELPSEDD